MYFTLICHPETPSGAIESVEADVERLDGKLAIMFTLYGDDLRLVLPPETEARRARDLWQTTCFEAFVRRPGEAAYREYNVSPSTEWAVYAFDGYREGMREAPVTQAPSISLTGYEKVLEVPVVLPLDPADEALIVGISLVLEEKDGTKSYWALAHPPGKPDFHDPVCFALELPVPL